MVSKYRNLKSNVMAGLAGQIYVTLVGILLLPLYLKYMGSEAYGLVGFFAMLQGVFSLLDLGLTSTISRESSRYNAGLLLALKFRQLYRALIIIFMMIAGIAGTSLFFLADNIANDWLNIVNLDRNEVVIVVELIAIIISMRWMTGLPRGILTGFEELVWINAYNVIFTTFRFVGVFISMWLYGFTPLVFFIHQIVVSAFELLIIYIKTYQLLPSYNQTTQRIGWSLAPILEILKFSLAVGFTSSIWILVTQTDKFILSGTLSLEHYAYFSLSIVLANGILLISAPITTAIMPRMSRLFAEGKQIEMIMLYRKATRFVIAFVSPIALLMIIKSEAVLYLWTNDMVLAKEASPILQLYTAGNFILAVSGFTYYLQYAKGKLKYHIIGNILFIVILIPNLIYFSKNGGAIGAGKVWFIANALYLIVWVNFVHFKLEKEMSLTWIYNDVFKTISPILISAYALSFIKIDLSQNLFMILNPVIISGITLLLVSILSTKEVRTYIKDRLC